MIACRRMKKVTLHSTSREHFLFLAMTVGKILHTKQREKPWMIDVNGDQASAKSVFALAADIAYRPEKFPEGITPDIIADYHFASPETDPIIFFNAGPKILDTKKNYDAAFKWFAQRFPAAKIIMLANIMRDEEEPYYNYENGFGSDVLDVGILVQAIRYLHDIEPHSPDLMLIADKFHQASMKAHTSQDLFAKFFRRIEIYVEDNNPMLPLLLELEQNQRTTEFTRALD